MPNVKVRVEAVSNDELESQKQGEEVSKKDATGEKLVVASLFAHQALNTAKQITNYAISNIGNFTGDYAKQDRVQQIVNNVSDVGTIGVAFATNWVAGVVATIGVATKRVLEVVSDNQAIRHAEHNAEYLRKRSGDSTTNGSR